MLLQKSAPKALFHLYLLKTMMMILAAITKDIPGQELLSPRGFPVEIYIKPILKALTNSRLTKKNSGRDWVRTTCSLKFPCLVSIFSSLRRIA